MDADSSRSPESVTVVISSDIEPVKCSGLYRSFIGGFILEFSIGQEQYTITHEQSRTVFCCVGSQTYELTLSDVPSKMTLNTPYGSLLCSVKTLRRDVEVTDSGVMMDLCYTLETDGNAAERNIKLEAYK